MNLRILSKFLIPVGPAQAERDRHANPGDPWYVSARTLQVFKESNSPRSSAPGSALTADSYGSICHWGTHQVSE
jgi:hypothetical protein